MTCPGWYLAPVIAIESVLAKRGRPGSSTALRSPGRCSHTLSVSHLRFGLRFSGSRRKGTRELSAAVSDAAGIPSPFSLAGVQLGAQPPDALTQGISFWGALALTIERGVYDLDGLDHLGCALVMDNFFLLLIPSFLSKKRQQYPNPPWPIRRSIQATVRKYSGHCMQSSKAEVRSSNVLLLPASPTPRAPGPFPANLAHGGSKTPKQAKRTTKTSARRVTA